MSWVKVIGKVRFQNVGDHVEPAVDALKVAPIPQPSDQYSGPGSRSRKMKMISMLALVADCSPDSCL